MQEGRPGFRNVPATGEDYPPADALPEGDDTISAGATSPTGRVQPEPKALIAFSPYFYQHAMIGMSTHDILHYNMTVLRRKLLIRDSADRIVRRYA